MSHNQFKRHNNYQSASSHQNKFHEPLWRKENRQRSKNFDNRHDYSTGQSREHNSRSPTPIKNRNQERERSYQNQKGYQRRRWNQRNYGNNHYHQKVNRHSGSKKFNQNPTYSTDQKYSHLYQANDHQIQDDMSTQPSIEQKVDVIPFKQPEPQRNHQRLQNDLLQIDPEKSAQNFLQMIQLLNYNNLTDIIQREFLETCKDHVYFIGGKPESKTKIGEILLKNGIFHEMWGKVLLKNTVFDRDIITPVYYQKYKDKIEKNATNFQISFNPIPQSPTEVLQFKRYRKLFDTSTNFTTKLNCMKLYEEIRRSVRDEQSQQLNSILARRNCSWQSTKAEIGLEIRQKEFDQDQAETIKTLQKIGYQMDPDTKTITAKREKSPQTGRFRLMEQTQTNQRRASVQMACVFLNIEKIFHISDVDIVRVRECYKNDKVQLAVVQGYVAEFDQKYRKMKIEPKQKTLVAAYKFVGLEQLIRIQKTYGAIYGLMVYDEHLDIKKYLDNIQKCRIICNS